MGNIMVVLKGDNGKYLGAALNSVPGTDIEAAFVHATDPTAPYARWVLTHLDNGKYTFRNVLVGKYLTRCHGCMPTAKPEVQDSATVHVTSSGESPAQWTLQQQPNGKFTLQADSAKFLARCEGCIQNGPLADSAFVHAPDPGASYAQWTITLVL